MCSMKVRFLQFLRRTLFLALFWVISSASTSSVFAQTYEYKSVLSAEGNSSIAITDNGGGKITFTTEGAERVHIDSNGNVGIGKSPTAKLDVNGTMRVRGLDTSKASYILIYLNQCSASACPAGPSQPSGVWLNASAQGYGWAVSVNTTPSIFTHNGTGTVTINKTGTYRIRLHGMFVPVSNSSAPVYFCPFINGSANCNAMSIYSSGIVHGYYPENMWGKTQHDFVFTLNQGATVGYGYHITSPLTNWAHDYYTSIEITEIN